MAQIVDTPEGQVIQWVTGQDALLMGSDQSCTGSDTLGEYSSLESLRGTENEQTTELEWQADIYSNFGVAEYSRLFGSGVIWGFATALCCWAFARAAAIPWNIFEKITGKGENQDVY